MLHFPDLYSWVHLSVPVNMASVETQQQIYTSSHVAPAQEAIPKWNFIFQPSMFRCELLVSGRVVDWQIYIYIYIFDSTIYIYIEGKFVRITKHLLLVSSSPKMGSRCNDSQRLHFPTTRDSTPSLQDAMRDLPVGTKKATNQQDSTKKKWILIRCCDTLI